MFFMVHKVLESRQSILLTVERRASNPAQKTKNMKNDKIIRGAVVRKDSENKGFWNVMESRSGQLTGKVAFTGTLKEVRGALKLAGK